MQTLGERLKHSRQAAKYSQEQLAAAVGISRVMVTKLEGGSCLRSGHIPKIANLLRVDPLWLAEGVNSTNAQIINLETNSHKAHQWVKQAIRDGYLPKPSTLTCQDCGQPAQVYDHRDYNRPLDVEPVCHACNIKRGPALPFVHVNDR
jgi:transcriptional regulator with XRE-family HTH domain